MVRRGLTTKLLSIGGLAVVALALSAVASVMGLNGLVGGGQRIYERGVVGIATVSGVSLAIEAQSALVGRAPSELNLEMVQKYQAEFARRSGDIDAGLAALAASGLDPARARLAEEIRTAATAYRGAAEKVFGFAASFAQEQAVKTLQGDFAAAEGKIRTSLNELVKVTNDVARAEAAAMRAAASAHHDARRGRRRRAGLRGGRRQRARGPQHHAAAHARAHRAAGRGRGRPHAASPHRQRGRGRAACRRAERGDGAHGRGPARRGPRGGCGHGDVPAGLLLGGRGLRRRAGAGLLARGDGRVTGGDHGHREADRGQRAAGQSARRGRA